MTDTATRMITGGKPGRRREWTEWRRKVRAVPDDQLVTDALTRSDYPGTDDGWDDLVALDQTLRRLMASRRPPPPRKVAPPTLSRIPHAERRTLTDLDQQPHVDTAGAWVARWHGASRPHRGLMFVGPTGTGKTAVAAAIAHDCDPHAYWREADLVQHIRDADRNGDGGFHRRQLAGRSLLVLDDLGASRATDYVASIIRELIEARYERRQPGCALIVTTNLREAERVDWLGARAASRLMELCEVVPVAGKDRRTA